MPYLAFLKSNWKLIAVILAFISVLGYAKVQTVRLHRAQEQVAAEKVKNLDLETKIKLQNDAIDQMKVDATRREEEGKKLVEQAKIEAQSHQQKARVIYTSKPVGDDCKAALELGNRK